MDQVALRADRHRGREEAGGLVEPTRPWVHCPRLGGDGIALETREVPSITPAQIAAVQVTPSNTVSALAAVPVNQATADTDVKDARTVLTAIATRTIPADMQNRATINDRLLHVVTIQKMQYHNAPVHLTVRSELVRVQNASMQSWYPFRVPDSVLAQQRTAAVLFRFFANFRPG